MKTKKPVIHRLESLISKETFNSIINYYEIELFQLVQDKKTIFLDEKEILKNECQIGTMLYSRYADQKHFMFFTIVCEDDSLDEYKDILDDDEYDTLLEDGTLPDSEYSNVSRKLQNLGALPEYQWKGEIISERVQISKPTLEDIAEIYIESTTFPSGYMEHSVLIYSEDKNKATSIMEAFLSEHHIRNQGARPKMETFFKLLESFSQ